VSTEGVREEEFRHADRADYEQQAVRDIPSHRLAEPDEVAALVLFLCSPAARYVNGAAIVADGAYYQGHWTDLHDPEAP
jgi:NAD(P)-dependent dehydrogenase (short-subunit alcohol dehydrogenase family)